MPHEPLDADDAIRLYQSGESEQSIAKRMGVSRHAMRRILLAGGVTPRNRGEALRVAARRATEDERRERVAAAHAARRGMSASATELARKAQTRERSLSSVSAAEVLLAGWVRDLGHEVVMQKAVGPYNVDLAVGPIAVEVWGGGYHLAGRHSARLAHRTRYLLDAGWGLMVVWVEGRRYPLRVECAERVVAHVEAARRDPSVMRQYRVVGGGGEDVPALEAKVNDLAGVRAFG